LNVDVSASTATQTNSLRVIERSLIMLAPVSVTGFVQK
jgi:hypothetical protein